MENAAFKGLSALPVASTASAGLIPKRPNKAAPPAAATVLIKVRRVETEASSLLNICLSLVWRVVEQNYSRPQKPPRFESCEMNSHLC